MSPSRVVSFLKVRKNHVTALLLVALMMLSAFILFYRLGNREFIEDEFLTVEAAAGYVFTGDFYRWDWLQEKSVESEDVECLYYRTKAYERSCHYTRAWPHSFLVAQSYRLFGISEWSSRLPSVLFGVAFVPILFLFCWYFFRSRWVGLVTAATFVLLPPFIFLFRTVRMYALVVPLFLLLLVAIHWFVSNLLNPDESFRASIRSKTTIVSGAASFVLFSFLLVLHSQVLIVVPATALFLFYLFLARRSLRKKFVWVALGFVLLGGLAVFIAWRGGWHAFSSELFSFSLLEEFKWRNVEHLVQFFVFWPLSSLLLLVGSLSIVRSSRVTRERLFFLIGLLVLACVYFIFFSKFGSSRRGLTFRYIAFLVPVAAALSFYGAHLLLLWGKRFFSGRRWHVLVVAASVFLVSSAGYLFWRDVVHVDTESWYLSSPEEAKRFRDAYETVFSDADPGDVVFAHRYSQYYLQGLADTETSIEYMPNEASYPYSKFLAKIQQHDSGWVVWEADKDRHIDKRLRAFCRAHFRRVHAPREDGHAIVVYRFTKEMIPSSSFDE